MTDEQKYTLPASVTSPKHKLILGPFVLKDTGYDGYSVAAALWRYNDDKIRLTPLFRWNGTATSPLGSPNTRGNATWQVIPESLLAADLRESFLALCLELNFSSVVVERKSTVAVPTDVSVE